MQRSRKQTEAESYPKNSPVFDVGPLILLGTPDLVVWFVGI